MTKDLQREHCLRYWPWQFSLPVLFAGGALVADRDWIVSDARRP